MNTTTTKTKNKYSKIYIPKEAVSEATSPRCEATQVAQLTRDIAYWEKHHNALQRALNQKDAQLAQVTAQRDELLAAANVAIQWLRKANSTSVFENCALPLGGVNAEKQLTAAISKAEAKE